MLALHLLAKKEVEECYTGICDNDNKYIMRIEAHYIPLIERLAKDNWYRINNETHFIADCSRKIKYEIRSFDSARSTIRSFKKRLRKRNVRREDIA